MKTETPGFFQQLYTPRIKDVVSGFHRQLLTPQRKYMADQTS